MKTGRRVYSVGATKKLLDRLKTPIGPPVTEPSTVLGNWYATVLLWRPQVAMFVNERTFLPVFVRLATASSLTRRFPSQLADVLERFGIDPRFVAAEIDAMADVSVAKTADRRVLGVMNELAFQCDVRIGHGFDPSDLVALSVDVAHGLLTPLFKDRDGRKPRPHAARFHRRADAVAG